MNCPNCGNEMEPGWIYGSAPLLWSQKPAKKTLLRGKEDVSLLSGHFPVAYLCKPCRKVVLEY